MAKRLHRIDTVPSLLRQDALLQRMRKFRRKGDPRKALVALREACLLDERAAWLWTLYGAHLAEAGREADAEQALRHALWLRRAANDAPRMRSTRQVLDRLATANRAA